MIGDETPAGTAREWRASAPGRCGIIGNPSDIYGGVVVSCSVPLRNSCRLRRVENWGPLHDDSRLIDAVQRRFPIDFPYEVEWDSQVPRSSGLSGSTAALAALTLCHLEARQEPAPTGISLAELVRDIERYDADIVCGFQDATMIALGGLHKMTFSGKRPDVRGGQAPTAKLLTAELPFLLITTGVERLSGSVHGPLAERWLGGEKLVVDSIARIAEIGEEGAEFLTIGDWDGLAEAMTENHCLVRDMGGSGDEIEALIFGCVSQGAKAAKLAGAGHGGTVIALAEDPLELQLRLSKLGYSKFIVPKLAEGARLEPANRL